MITAPKTDSIKLSDCATTLEEARGVIDRQEALIAELRKDKARLDWLTANCYSQDVLQEPGEVREDVCLVTKTRLRADRDDIDAAMEATK
jgi:hypothetical protein